MDPAYVQQLRNNGMMQLGLGMMSAGSKPGATFGSAFGAGLGQASTSLQGAMQTAYQNARAVHADKRADTREDRELQREDRLDKRQQYLEDHQLGRETVTDQRFKEEQQFRQDQAGQAQQHWQAEQGLRQKMADQRGLAQPPMGYRYKPDGSMEFIPGGPADPSVASGNRTLRPIPAPAAQGLIQNRTSIAKIDNALAALDGNPDAFGMKNYLPDMATQRMSGKGYEGGVDARGKVADIGSLIIHDRSGAAVTASEMPRLKPFIPASTDDPKTVKTKLGNLKANLQLMQDEIEGFYTPDMGYRPLTPQGASQQPAAAPRGLGAPPPQANPAGVAQRAESYY